MTLDTVRNWARETFVDLARQFRWSFLPPLMVYLAAGVSGLTGIVGTFFIKEYLGLSAAFLAGLAFWAGLPWALKMPIGHLVDLIWRWKSWLVYLGAGLIAISVSIMYGLIAHRAGMERFLPAEAWFVVSTLLAPTGYVVQDVVADAMTVEAVPLVDERGEPLSSDQIKIMHTTMQTLGRFAIIGGTVLVAALNIAMFSNVEAMSQADKAGVYASIYLMALAIPVISIIGVSLGDILLRRRALVLRDEGVEEAKIQKMLFEPEEATSPNWWILGGSAAFVAFTLAMGLSDNGYAQEIIFAGSMAIVLFLMRQLLQQLDEPARWTLVGTAIIIFVFRATPLAGPGVGWFEIDVLGFDQRFMSVLSFIASGLTLLGIIVLRPLMANNSLAWLVAFLSIVGAVLTLPSIGLYYGLHHWTSAMTGGIVDARFIAVINTTLESPLGQVAMIPMLAWIAKNAPANLKATFFAVMASFTNLALSAGALLTKYMNQIFLVSREVRDPATGAIKVAADYSQLGMLLITVTLIALAVPLATIFLVQRSRLRTSE